MVVLHPSRSKSISTQSAEAFWDERIADFLPGEKPPKMQFWRLMLSIWYFLFYFKEVSHSIRHHMIRCKIFTKKLARNALYKVLVCPKLHLRALTLSKECHLFFSSQTTAFF